jgi:radical SAM protein with 4Fe4S-binding SPASM domain
MHIDLADDIGYYPSWEQGYARSSRKESSFWTGCHAGLQVLGIDSNGDIKGCQSLPSTPEFIEGNVKTRSLKEIWHKPDGFVYNRQFKLEQLRGYCGECRHAPLCKAGCTSSALAFSGHTGDNPMCVYRAEQTIRVTS